MTTVHLDMWTDSGGLLMNTNEYNLVINMTKLRIFLRQNVIPISNIVDVLADCLYMQFPNSQISTDGGLRWSIKINADSANVVDKMLYDIQINKALIDFFENDIVKKQIRETMPEIDRSTFYNILNKFSSGELNPINITNTLIVPNANEYYILIMDF